MRYPAPARPPAPPSPRIDNAMRSLAGYVGAAVLLLPAATPAAEPAAPQALEFFEKRVRPVLVEHCQGCHGPDKHKGGLRLDSKAAFLKGGAGGPVVVPGQPDKSPLVLAVRHG